MMPLKNKTIKKKRIFGFDVETTGKDNDFYMCSLFTDGWKKTYYSKEDFFYDLANLNIFRNSYITATNLSFDYHAVFNLEISKDFRWILRNSDFIMAKTYPHNGKFHKLKVSDSRPIIFIDTMNFYHAGVKKLGECLGIEKLSSPKCLGRIPENDKEKKELEIYNMRDSEISYLFIKRLFDSFIDLGAEPKATIAATAMNLFRRKYLKEAYYVHDELILEKVFNSYYGGRNEAFCRGKIENCYLYDVNSMYPYTMLNEMPDPNTVRFNKKGIMANINNFLGVSDVSVFCPDGIIPLLPYRYGNKLLFPSGSFSGWYTHVELKKAVSLGYVITDIREQIYYKETCRPFNDYVIDLYSKRKAEKKEFMRLVYKILLNSLYGKFAQKYKNKSQWQPNDFTYDELMKMSDFEIKNGYIRIKKDAQPPAFCMPIWASYITAYSRCLLYDYIRENDVIYCDTDSIITKNIIPSSEELGRMKLELFIKSGVIVKPKFYELNNDAKIKGIPKKTAKAQFNGILAGEKAKYDRFMTFAQGLRMNIKTNSIVSMEKAFNMEDDKRIWESRFNKNEFQVSMPIIMENGFDEKIYKKAELWHQEEMKKSFNNKEFDDFFDSIGKDISREEFFKNELFFDRI